MTSGPAINSSLAFIFPMAGVATSLVLPKLIELVERGYTQWVMIPDARGFNLLAAEESQLVEPEPIRPLLQEAA